MTERCLECRTEMERRVWEHGYRYVCPKGCDPIAAAARMEEAVYQELGYRESLVEIAEDARRRSAPVRSALAEYWSGKGWSKRRIRRRGPRCATGEITHWIGFDGKARPVLPLPWKWRCGGRCTRGQTYCVRCLRVHKALADQALEKLR